MGFYRVNPNVDSNQSEIVEALRAIGCSVIHLSRVGSGCPDLLVGLRGDMVLMEIKVPTGKLSDGQLKFISNWRGTPVAVVRDIDEALKAAAKLGCPCGDRKL